MASVGKRKYHDSVRTKLSSISEASDDRNYLGCLSAIFWKQFSPGKRRCGNGNAVMKQTRFIQMGFRSVTRAIASCRKGLPSKVMLYSLPFCRRFASFTPAPATTGSTATTAGVPLQRVLLCRCRGHLLVGLELSWEVAHMACPELRQIQNKLHCPNEQRQK